MVVLLHNAIKDDSNPRMKYQPTAAILLSVSIGIAIQLQCLCGASVAAEQEPGVPVETPAVDSTSDSTSTDSAPNVPAPSAPNIPPGSTPAQKIDSESSKTSEPNSSDVISPVVPPTNWVETYPHGAPIEGRVLEVDTNLDEVRKTGEQKLKPPVDPERESKGTLLGKIGKSLLKGGTNKNVPIAERPWWIPGNAYTDDAMVAPYHNLDIAWWDKRPMPNRPQWVRLSTSVTRYWRGTVSEPCFVLITPMEQVPGNFTFRSRSFGGPRGWLQALNVPDKKGFPQYRYWLDQR